MAFSRAGKALILALAVGLLPAGCARHPAGLAPTRPPGSALKPPGVLVEVEKGRLVMNDPRRGRIWEGRASSMEYDQARDLTVLSEVRCSFIEKGKVMLSVRAPRAVVDQRRRVIVLEQGVTGTAPASSGRLAADRLEYDTESKRLTASGHLQFSQAGLTTSGDRLESDLSLKQGKVTGHPVRVQGLMGG